MGWQPLLGAVIFFGRGSQIYKKSAPIKLRPPISATKILWPPSLIHHTPKQAKIVLKSVFLNKINTLSVVILWLPTFLSSKILWPPYFSFQKFMAPCIFGTPPILKNFLNSGPIFGTPIPKKMIAPYKPPNHPPPCIFGTPHSEENDSPLTRTH